MFTRHCIRALKHYLWSGIKSSSCGRQPQIHFVGMWQVGTNKNDHLRIVIYFSLKTNTSLVAVQFDSVLWKVILSISSKHVRYRMDNNEPLKQRESAYDGHIVINSLGRYSILKKRGFAWREMYWIGCEKNGEKIPLRIPKSLTSCVK